MRKFKSILRYGAGIFAIAAAQAALAQFSDDFESYAAGSAIAGQGGWEEWAGSTDVSGHISTLFANSGTKSLEIMGNPGGTTGLGDDTVHRFTGATSGRWIFKIMTYVPSTASGTGWVILMNTYPPPTGSAWWSVQVQFNATANTVKSVHTGAPTVPLVEDQWVEFRVEVDLDTDMASYFYNNQALATNVSWRNLYATGGAQDIAAVDLYGGEPTTGGITGMYFDDVMLMPAASTTTILPTMTSLTPGIVISGTPMDMYSSNDTYYILRPGIVFSTQQDPLVLNMSGTAPGNTPSDLKIVVESKANQGNIRERIQVWNFNTSMWTELSSVILTTGDTVKTLTIAMPAQYVGPGNEVRARLIYKAAGPVFSYPWLISIDEATWRYTN